MSNNKKILPGELKLSDPDHYYNTFHFLEKSDVVGKLDGLIEKHQNRYLHSTENLFTDLKKFRDELI